MTKKLLIVIMLASGVTGYAQKQKFDIVTASELEAHMRFLASDELQGRMTGELGNNIASRYISSQFRKYGLKPAVGNSYFQAVPFVQHRVGREGTLTLGRETFALGDDFVIMDGHQIDLESDCVFAGYGLSEGVDGEDDYAGKKVAGKIVIALMGYPDATRNNFTDILNASEEKKQLAAQHGAAGLIEIYTMAFPWNGISRRYGRSRLSLETTGTSNTNLAHVWLNLPDNKLEAVLDQVKGKRCVLKADGIVATPVQSRNVVGIVEGTDPVLKDQYILVSAHFDHVGTKTANSPEEDTIFNGARDNGLGTVSVLAAAKAISANPLKRSVIFAAWTGEERGLLGSRYFSQNPVVDMGSIVFNWNNDNGAYNDTTIAVVIGLDRTTAADAIRKGCADAGLEAYEDPDLHASFFNRSDNVNFARLGVPSPTYSSGFRTWDESITRYYHQTADNPETLDFNYLYKFAAGFTLCLYRIDELTEAPFWTTGDSYYEAGQRLYGRY